MKAKKSIDRDTVPEPKKETLPPGGGSWLRLPDGSLVPNPEAEKNAKDNPQE